MTNKLCEYGEDPFVCTNNPMDCQCLLDNVLKEKETTWQGAALRLGEELASVGPDGYYSFTPKQWLDWALQNTKNNA